MSYFKYDGSAASLTGGPAKNFYGTGGADTISGSGGADGLWGGQGDHMAGGAGDDTYYVKNGGDQVVERAGGGVDKIVAWMSIDLSRFQHVENLQISGDGLLKARGNDLDNVILCGAGSQEINGGRGQDVLIGGAGKDTFVVVKGEGNDVIQDFSPGEDKVKLTADLKVFADIKAHLVQRGADVHLDLGGGDGLIFRNLSADKLTADHFQWPTAPTTMTATATAFTAVVAPPTQGPILPTILPTGPTASTNLGSTEAARGSVGAAKNFYGTKGQDTIAGASGADGLWGGQGDVMVGGAGDDTYYLKSGSDRVVEQVGGGVDKIHAWMNIDLRKFENVENVYVSGDKLYAAGNNQSNYVQGGDGAQQIYGGGGLDVLSGGAGADTFLIIKGEGNDIILDFDAGEDRVRLTSGLTDFEQVKARLSQQGSDVRLDLGGGDALTFKNLTADKLSAGNFQLQLDVTRFARMTFADEFNGPLSLWDKESSPKGTWRPDYDLQGVQGFGSYTLASNGELQIYTSPYFRGHNGDFAESPFVNNPDGTLSIWAKPSTNPEIYGFGYTSGMLSTKESFAQTYGYFEMRADAPDAAGTWPTFWLLPTDRSWPPELDVMEVLGKDASVTYTTSHSAIGGHTIKGTAHYTPETADGMHTYGVLWSPETLIWYLDGIEVFRSATPADMHKPMYMIANMALGGWGGAVGAEALPAEFKIDYIRAYELPTDWATF